MNIIVTIYQGIIILINTFQTLGMILEFMCIIYFNIYKILLLSSLFTEQAQKD